MAPQAQEILDRIDDYLKYQKSGGGAAEGGSEWEKLTPLIQEARARLHEMRQHAPVNQLPDGSKGRWFKRPLMRLMRLVSGRQASYNYTAIDAMEALLAALEASARATGASQHRMFDQKSRELSGQLAGAIAESREKLDGVAAKVQHYDPVTVLTEVRSLREKVENLNNFANEMGQSISGLKNWVEGNLTPRTNKLEALVGEDSQSGFNKNLDLIQATHSDLGKTRDELSNLYSWVDKTLTPTTMDLKEKVRELQIRAEQAPAAQIMSTLASHQMLINEHTGQISYLSRKVEPLETHVKERQDQFGRELLIVLRDLERRFEQTLERTKAAQSPEERQATGEAVLEVLDQVRYFYFELRARGGEEYLKKKFSGYVETIGAALNREAAGGKAGKPRALDLGCGNGLYLSLMAGAGFEALGVDSNAAMLASARARGVAVEQDDALGFLARQPENSFDVISAMEFIEHLPKERLVEFAGLAARALRPGGVLLLETLNAKTFAAYQWFFMDLTHQWLVLPEALQVVLEARGLEIVHVEELSPVEDWKKLAEIEDSPERENVKRLNAALFGMQEYYCLARKPR